MIHAYDRVAAAAAAAIRVTTVRTIFECAVQQVVSHGFRYHAYHDMGRKSSIFFGYFSNNV